MQDNEIIDITDMAKQQIRTIFDREPPKDGQGLRFAVEVGGCSGLNYKINYSEKQDDDHIINLEYIEVLVDPQSVPYIKGIQLDFQDGFNGKGFVFNNPNAKTTCGCGESFSI
ncbi:iron-sulfur cluster assembly accessory protein [bacterium K02(2017)]|nr:iron-sulfur cluster assembly accessory protein [bacterium K02(2017)]